jgi:hypothetical protein
MISLERERKALRFVGEGKGSWELFKFDYLSFGGLDRLLEKLVKTCEF